MQEVGKGKPGSSMPANQQGKSCQTPVRRRHHVPQPLSDRFCAVELPDEQPAEQPAEQVITHEIGNHTYIVAKVDPLDVDGAEFLVVAQDEAGGPGTSV